MSEMDLNVVLKKEEFLGDHYGDILDFIDKNGRIMLDANPGTGKTSLFVKLSLEIKKGIRKGRIIFCAPYLIIQSQFNKGLNKKGSKADLVLNHASKRKKMHETDQVIISTYQSLSHIANDLTPEDLIVIDEAHTLAYSYSFGNDRQYYETTVNLLMSTRAKLVLMSGTPNQEINDLLKLKAIKVKKEDELKSKIKLLQSSHSSVDIAEAFANQAVAEYGPDYLNIIYFKDVQKCEIIKERLESLGYIAKVITSYHKKQEVYKELVEYSLVNTKVQFLICTNAISTGTNVENTNIGKALMINESNPEEIKQFSKRFRRKLDIEVSVVNSSSPKQYIVPTPDMPTALKNTKKEIDDIINNICQLKSLDIPEEYQNSYDKSELGTKKYLIGILANRCVKQIAFLRDLRAQQCTDISLLKANLEQYSDVDIKVLTSLSPSAKTKTHSEAQYKKEIDSVRKDFIKDFQNYSDKIVNGEIIDYHTRTKFQFSAGKEYIPGTAIGALDINNKLRNPFFEKEILEPACLANRLVGDFKKSIFLTKLNPRKLNKLLVSLYVNKYLNKYVKIEIVVPPINLVNINLNPIGHLSMEQCFMIDVIKEILEYSYGKDNVVIEDLKSHLDAKFKKRIPSLDLTRFPLKHIIANDGEFSKEYLRSILDGIIFTKSGTNKKKQKTGSFKSAVIFRATLPKDLGYKDTAYKEDYKEIKSAQTVILLNESMVIKKIKANPIIIVNKALILEEHLKNYYKL